MASSKSCDARLPSKIKECIITTRVRGKELFTLIDSGATNNMVGTKIFEVIPGLKDHLKLCKQKVSAIAINGEILEYPAYLDFVVNLDGRSIPIRALYSPKINYELILGFNFLKEHSCKFDFEQMKLILPRIGIVRTAKEIIWNQEVKL